MRKIILATSAIAMVAAAGEARDENRLSRECRREVVQLCGMNRDKIRACLKKKSEQLSARCLGELRDRLAERMAAADAKGRHKDDGQVAALGGVEQSYGDDRLQKLDFYAAKNVKGPAPLIIFVHGGGWKRGAKDNATGVAKIKHYTGLGYHFATINYRLVPQNTVEEQAADVARAIAHLRSNAAKLGIDGARIVLMGHSAGAHLSALVGTDPQYLRGAGLDLGALAGVVPIDGAAYDVPKQMTDGNRMMQGTYKQAFGTEPERQKALSPFYQAQSPNAPSFLILHVQRADGVRQSTALADALRAAGTPVQRNGFDGDGLAGHRDINRKLGEADYPATPVVDAWLKGIFAK